jgi:DNA-binding transcriptional ArsR family regulator
MNISVMPGPTATVVFSLLADPTRRRVVELLAQEPRRAGDLAVEVGTSPQAMSNHLRVLLDAGVVADGRLAEDARARVFRLRPQSFTALQAWLDQVQAEWRVQLGSFKRHVEERS